VSAVSLPPSESFPGEDVELLREALAIDFTNIFHHPEGKIMPYEGVILAHETELHGPKSEEVERFLAHAGYRVPPEGGEMADHIAVELEFTADLARREAVADRPRGFLPERFVNAGHTHTQLIPSTMARVEKPSSDWPLAAMCSNFRFGSQHKVKAPFVQGLCL